LSDSVETPTRDETVPPADQPSTSRTNYVTPTPDFPSWPVPYKLPAFPPEVQRRLAEGDVTFHRAGKSPPRAALIAVLADDITRYTW